ncbi:MAG: hypothetical protein P8Y71_28285 [Pseudolabrys sp.]
MRSGLIALAALALLGLAPAAAQPVVSPARGAPLRAAVLDALRPTVERETGGKVIFVVHALNVMGAWAYADVEPRRPDGEKIDWRKTRFRRAFEADVFSGLVLALLRRKDGAWTVADYIVGPTDVYWYNWVTKYKLPEALFKGP